MCAIICKKTSFFTSCHILPLNSVRHFFIVSFGKSVKHMRKTILILLAALSILAASCSMAYEGTGSVDVSVQSAGSGSRSVMPGTYVEPEYYRVSIEKDDSVQISSAEFSKDNPSVTFHDIPFGSYTAVGYGYTDAGRKNLIAMGSAELTVGNGSNSVSIVLSPIGESELDLKGKIVLNLDFAEGMQVDEIRLVSDALAGTDTESASAESAVVATKKDVVLSETGGYQLNLEIPVGLGQSLHLEYFSSGQYLGRSASEIYNIYAGQTAVSMQNDGSENDLYRDITFSAAKNLTTFEIMNPTALNSLTVEFTVPDYEFDFIEFSVGQGAGSTNKQLSYSELSSYSGQKTSHTFSNLADSTEYKISARVRHTTGKYSPYLDRFMKTATPLGSVSLVYDDAIKALSPGQTYQFGLSYSPVTATDFGGTWSVTSGSEYGHISEKGLLSVTGIGQIVVTYEAKNNSKTNSVTVDVRLDKPEVASPVFNSETNAIDLTWKASGKIVDHYDIYRKTDGGAESKIGTVKASETSYSDTDITSGHSYSYMVKALTEDEANYSESAWTSQISTVAPTISMSFQPGPTDIDLMDGIQQNQVFTYDKPLVIEVSQREGYSYQWILNDTVISTTNRAEINSTLECLNKTELQSYQSLMLVITDNESGYKYSGSLNLFYVEDLKDLPDYDVLSVTSEGGKRFSTQTAEGSARTIQLSATTEKDLPYITWSVPEDNGIATVDPATGLVTLTGGWGEVTVTAKPTYGDGAAQTITLDIYKATVSNAVMLVNAINTTWRNHFEGAASAFGDDWARTIFSSATLNYDSDGFHFTRPSDSISDNSAYATINASIVLGEGDGNTATVKTNGNVGFSLYDHQWDGAGTAAGTEDLKIISCNNQSLFVELPFNQGTAEITYESIRVKTDGGENTRGGYYSVDFSEDILGTEGQNLDRTGDYKIDDAVEAANITKLIY